MTTKSEDLQIERPTGRFWQGAFTAISYLPWVWLLLMGIFTLITTLIVGHFPSYEQPDPKDIGILNFLYFLIIILLPIAFISLIFWVLFGLSKHFLSLPFAIRRQEVIPFVSGWLVFIWFVFSDFAGLVTWLGD